MRLWARIGLGFVVAMVGLGAITAMAPKPEVSISCKAQGGAGDCVIDNKGGAGAEVKFQTVLVCRDGEHVADVAAHVDARSHVTKVIDEFSPNVGMLTKCVGIDYRNTSVK